MRQRRLAVLALTAALPMSMVVSAQAVAPPHEGGADLAWGTNGVATLDFSDTSTTGSVDDLVVAPDDRVIVAGNDRQDGIFRFAVARLLANGSPDTSFSGDGRTTTTMGSGDAVTKSVAIGPNGRVVVSGYAASTSYNIDAIAVYRTDGTLDPAFSGDGRVFTDWGSDSSASAVTVQPDGRILTTGFRQTGADSYDLTVTRYTSAGALDASFGGGDGKVTTGIGGADDEGFAIVVQPDGRIVVGGYVLLSTSYVFGLARYLANGSPDTTFGGGDGEVTTSIGDNDAIQALRLMPDGRLVAGGYSNGGGGFGATVVRYLADGSLDPTFSGDGIVMPADTDVSTANDLVLQRNDRIVIVGSMTSGFDTGIGVARLNTNGQLDTSFDDDGQAVRSIDSGITGFRVGVQRDGTVLAAGNVSAPTAGQIAVVGFVGDLTAPFDGHVIGLSRWSTVLKPTVFWQASDDNTGVKSFDVRQRVANATAGSYGSFALVKSATALTAGTLPGATGRTSCVSVRARDWAGNLGAFGAESCVAFPVDDKNLAKTGSWTGLTGKAYYAGTARRSDDQGATLSLAGADYRNLALVADKCSGCGTVKVYRDATLLATVKLAAATTKHQVVIPIHASLTTLTGTIKIKITSSGKPVTIDGLGISLA